MRLQYDPFAAETRANPYTYYEQMRREAPVQYCPASNVWVISRYDDVERALTKPELFSSDGMRTLMLGIRPSADGAIDPVGLAKLLELTEVLPFGPEEMLAARNLIALDPPVHDLMRKLVNRGFTPRSVQAWSGRIEEVVAESLRRLEGAREFDLVASLTIPVPVTIIAEMLGVEAVYYERFKHWSDAIVAGATGSGRSETQVDPGFKRAIGEFAEYFQAICQARREDPQDDLVSILVRAEGDELGLTTPELVFFALLLLVAGNETTTNLVGNAVRALLAHPDQLALLRQDPSLVPDALEETLRYDGPVQFVFRRATRDVEVAGTVIPRDAIVLPLIGSANRDEKRFEQPDVFDIRREQPPNLAFGRGIHFCLGAALARLESRTMLRGLLDVLPAVEAQNEEPDFIDSFLVRGPRTLRMSSRA